MCSTHMYCPVLVDLIFFCLNSCSLAVEYLLSFCNCLVSLIFLTIGAAFVLLSPQHLSKFVKKFIKRVVLTIRILKLLKVIIRIYCA